jgi:amino acid adenylation domain-containing protein
LTAGLLLTRLRSLGVNLAAVGERLRISAARGKLTDDMKEEIAVRKEELLDLLRSGLSPDGSDLVSILRDGVLPLSLFQQRLWVIHRLDPANVDYNMATVWQIDKPIDAAQVVHAIRDLSCRHEILRSAFRDEHGTPRVHLLPVDKVAIVQRDLREVCEQEQWRIIQDDLATEAHTTFDLQVEPPLRWIVYQLAADRVATLASAHHIALDDWSLALLRRELATTCSGIAPGGPAPLQYVDYAHWQRRTQDPKAIAAELQWWERNLAGIPPVCSFPGDSITSNSGGGNAHSFCWDAEFTGSVRKMVSEEGATVYMGLLAACAVVLRAYTGLTDIVLGSPMGLRERPEFETMLGPFVNLLVLRLDLDGDPTFADVLARARNAVLDAFDHRQVPFETMVERLNPVRSWDHSPLFQVAVVMHNASDEPGPPVHGGGAIHDVTWFAREVQGQIEGTLEYRSDLYDAGTIDRIAGHLQAVLRAAVDDRHCNISRIPLLTATERRQVVETFNATSVALDPATFVVRFERQAAISAARHAVGFQGTRITYDELNRRANQLANHLRSLAVGRGVHVGICLDRSIEMVIALLGVQKAGGTYVPLDPNFPAERLEFMVADSTMTVLITAGGVAAGFRVPEDVRVIALDVDSAAIDVMDASNPEPVALPDDIAYVIYTSGSTGMPNGVAVSHRALTNFLCSMEREPGLTSEDVLAAVTTISFDIAALELYLPLMVGARIELVASKTATDGPALAELLSRSGATVLQATPVIWRLLAATGWRGCPGFRALCGGEQLPRDLANDVLDCTTELWNLYGPTETTVWSTLGRVERGVQAISVGRPIANTKVYVLDENLTPMALGLPGEIWIGGDGVATGYHRRPELTAARFVTDPYSVEPDARMYRTGDLGRWGADGRLYHMGRIDRQVKIRGLRIELEEIEMALSMHPAVRQSIVTARDSGSNDLRLIAYVLYEEGADLTASEARRYLRHRLPDYMVPSVFVAMERIPLTPNGKVDLRSLPDPFKRAMRATGSYERPAPGTEELLAGIWQDLLQVERVGAADNFFELGGNSLLSLRMVAAIRAQTGCDMQPRALFFQSLREVAAGLRRDQRTRAQVR